MHIIIINCLLFFSYKYYKVLDINKSIFTRMILKYSKYKKKVNIIWLYNYQIENETYHK